MQTDLRETAAWGTATLEDGVLKGVKLLGEKSKNGNRYPQAVRKSAHGLIEGLHVNINHPSRKAQGEDRPVESRIGKLVNVREEKDGTYADFHFLTKHPYAAVIVEAATRMPDVMGFSINGKGTVRKNSKGENIVESISELRSVDLVSDPGTVKSLFESEAPADEPVDPDAAMAEAFCQAVVAVVKGDGDLKSKLKKIKEILQAQEKMGGDDEGAAPDAAPDAPVEESWKEEYQTLKLEKQCRSLLESNKVQVEQPLVESLMAMNSDKARTEFVAWHKRTSITKSPRSSEPTRTVDEVKKDWANILRSK